jgi:triosephosphate isomerase
MLKDAGAEYVIIGHSERRGRFGVPEPELVGDLGRVFGDTDASVNAKLKAAFRVGLIPILCVGETLAERQEGTTDDVIRLQLQRALQEIPAEQAAKIIFAYEPVWAIGTKKTCDAIEANRVIAGIRRVVGDLYGPEVAGQVRITYGGSVKPDNVEKLMFQRDLDGGLVGGASLKVESFVPIVEACR